MHLAQQTNQEKLKTHNKIAKMGDQNGTLWKLGPWYRSLSNLLWKENKINKEQWTQKIEIIGNKVWNDKKLSNLWKLLMLADSWSTDWKYFRRHKELSCRRRLELTSIDFALLWSNYCDTFGLSENWNSCCCLLDLLQGTTGVWMAWITHSEWSDVSLKHMNTHWKVIVDLSLTEA